MSSPFQLNNITITAKIYGLATVLIGTLVICVTYTLYNINQIGDELVSIAEQDIPLTRAVSKTTIYQLEQAINFERALRYGESIKTENTAIRHFNEATKQFAHFDKLVATEITHGEKIAKEGMKLARNDAEYQEFKHVGEILQRIEKEHASYAKQAEHAFGLIRQQKLHETFEYTENVEKIEEAIDHELENLLSEIMGFTAAAALSAEHHEKNTFSTLLIVGLISTLLGAALAFWVIRAITGPIKKLQNTIEAIERDSDLTQRVNIATNDEIGDIGQSFDKMLEHFQSIVGQVNGSATQLSAAAEELSIITQETANGIQEQTSQTDQVATATNEMLATVQEVARNAGEAAIAANETTAEANKGRQVVNDAIDSMDLLASEIEQASSVINKLEEDGVKIGAVLDVIRGIAEQTNLLALNAAIEAARAGEQGRGFAVVADEVRTLASRTQTSTQEIQQMIESLQSGTKSAVMAMESSRAQAQLGVEKISTAGDALTTIVGGIERINDMNTQIASAAEEQSAVSEEINKNVVRISEISTTSAASSEQTQVASEELSRLSVDLQELVLQFKA